jgi:hypothetical protein
MEMKIGEIRTDFHLHRTTGRLQSPVFSSSYFHVELARLRRGSPLPAQTCSNDELWSIASVCTRDDRSAKCTVMDVDALEVRKVFS